MSSRANTVLIALALAAAGCSSASGNAAGWSTRLDPAPQGLTLDPAPPADLYWVAIVSAKLPPRTSGGQLWDEVGGWPDPVATLYVDDKEVMSTPTAEDTVTPTWTSPRGNLLIPASASLRIEVADQDALQSLPMGKGRAGAPTSTDLSEGRMVFDLGNRSEVIVKVGTAHGLIGLGFDYEIVAGKLLVREVMKHGPAGRAGLTVGDQIVQIGDRNLAGAKSREIRSSVNSMGSKPTKVIVKHKAGTTEDFSISVGPVYPLFGEFGDID